MQRRFPVRLRGLSLPFSLMLSTEQSIFNFHLENSMKPSAHFLELLVLCDVDQTQSKSSCFHFRSWDWFYENFALLPLVTEFFLLNLLVRWHRVYFRKAQYLSTSTATNNWGRWKMGKKERKIISIHKKQIYQKHRLDWIYRSSSLFF